MKTTDTTNTNTVLTITEYIKTANGKELRKLFRKYMNRKTVKTSEALEYLCVSELYFYLFEGSVNPNTYELPDGFQNVPAKEVMESFKSGWATSDYCSDILSCSNDTAAFEEFETALLMAVNKDGEDGGKEDGDGKKTKHIVNIHDIDWDCELVEGPHSANVPDLPEEIEDVEVEWDDESEDPDEAIGDWLSDTYGFCVNSFSWDCEFDEKVEK